MAVCLTLVVNSYSLLVGISPSNYGLVSLVNLRATLLQTGLMMMMIIIIIIIIIIALETLGPVNESAMEFQNNLGHRIASISSNDKEGQFLYQRLSIALQRFNASLLHESFVSDVDPDL